MIYDYSSELFGYYDIRNHYYATPKYRSIDPHFRDESANNMLFVGAAVINNIEFPIGYINSATEAVLCEYDYLEHGNPYYGKVLCMDVEGQSWIQSADGSRTMIDAQYELDSLEIGQGMFIIMNDQGYGLMSLSGKVMTGMNYTSIEFDPYDHCYYGVDDSGKESIVFAQITSQN